MKLTHAAKARLAKKTSDPNKALTISYVPCGCVGMQLDISIKKIAGNGRPQAKEVVDGFTVIYDLAAKDMLRDGVIDFDSRLLHYGFHLK